MVHAVSPVAEEGGPSRAANGATVLLEESRKVLGNQIFGRRRYPRDRAGEGRGASMLEDATEEYIARR